MSRREHYRVISRADALIERLQQLFDLAIQVQYQLVDERGIRADLIAQQRRSRGRNDQVVEAAPLPKLLLRHDLACQIELRRLAERRGLIQKHEVLRARRIVDE